MRKIHCGLMLAVVWSAGLAQTLAAENSVPEPLAGTKPLTLKGDITSQMVDGVDRFLLRKLEASIANRAKYWKRDFSSAAAYNKSIADNRKRLAHILGIRDQRVAFDAPQLIATTKQSALVGKGAGYDIFAVRWPVVGDMHSEGLLLVPRGEPIADVIAIPDADVTPEQLVGLTDGVAPESQFANQLAASGCRVLIPTLISRDMSRRAAPGRNGRANLTNREFVYRSAFELGRHLIGYELQKVLAGVDWFRKDTNQGRKIGVIGWGEGGMLALYAAALDTRIDAACVCGHFGSRQNIWQEPLDRNVFGLLEQFGDAELASMVAPRPLLIEASPGPQVTLPSEGGAPARLLTAKFEETRSEFQRAQELIKSFPENTRRALVLVGDGKRAHGSRITITKWMELLGEASEEVEVKPPKRRRERFDRSARQARLVHQMDRHNQLLLRESQYVRKQFMSKLDTSSLEKYEKSSAEYRQFFYNEVIGRFDDKPLPFNVRTRKAYDEKKWTGYEVVMDVFPDVIAYGVLLIPKDIKPGDKRPVVVCQHGLEGRPQDIISGDHRAYHDFAAKLAERGFVTFAPQNLYIFRDRFRTLQRKANPIKKSLFSVITPQHQQIIDWLKTLEYVDSERIAFYGLSYGGKTAMRVPALVTDYCLSICSADFNEWVWKNASTRTRYSYVFTGEYEIFEFDLGSTFNYSEMAALIAPRPFMVERGHFDGVSSDEAVAFEYAKVRNLYAARLQIPDRTEIEFFNGPHTINGKGTFDFLHRHLRWPRPK